MTKRLLAHSVYDAALGRLMTLYGGPYWPVVSFSGGKDSGVCVELAIEAARACGRLPVQVSMRDEEIMFPGTFEYAERLAQRPEIELHWWVAGQPIVNVYNRAEPYFWVFDDRLPPDRWVRQPPPFAKRLTSPVIQAVVSRHTFPQAPEGLEIIAVTGVRAAESPNRLMGAYSAGGWLNRRPPKAAPGIGVRAARVIFDWQDGDIWLAIHKYGWDYNRAYDAMHRLGVHRRKLRIAPPTLTAGGADHLRVASQAWPAWFDRLCERLPGVRRAAAFGRRAVEPQRRYGESWQQTFQRECIDEAPDWIAQRARKFSEHLLRGHRRHTAMPLPEVKNCGVCGQVSSWRQLALDLYNGDPFVSRCTSWANLKAVDPEFFRPGAGVWGRGDPTF